MFGRSATRRLGIISFALTLAAPAFAEDRTPQQFVCKDGTTFAVVVSDQIADVRFSPTEDYRLRSKPFSLGQRFVSPSATLIIDGRFAAFVTSERIGLENCTLADSSPGSTGMPDAAR